MSSECAALTVMSGADDGRVFIIDKVTFTLGRHPSDDVCLPHDRRVSRHHARITREGDSYLIEDFGPRGKGSANGTYVNDSGNGITGKTTLASGDMILLGSVLLRFETR